MMIGQNPAGRHGIGAILASFWMQMLVITIFAIIFPAVVFYHDTGPGDKSFQPLINSILGATAAILLGAIFVRRVTAYPGVRAFVFILPSLAATYAIVVTVFFFLRIDYGRLYFSTSFILAIIMFYAVNYTIDRYTLPRFFVVPFGNAKELVAISDVSWVIMAEPVLPVVSDVTIVADLRYDFDDNWERMLAEAAVKGYPVYHSKQLGESLTGRVSISHMSENSFGSLLPNLGYRKVKRVLDVIGALILIPLLVLPFGIIALLITLDSPGGAFFRQKRMGFRGKEFSMIKFRTMKVRLQSVEEEAVRQDAMTQSDDARITRVGRFLRRTRLDELPQVVNVLKGEMSLIGPRPEAVALSQWYEREIAFYVYRHIVRPGITGWAQVNQGHVADLDSVSQKLNYDFFYIKNFSSWLDLLIVFKTIHTVITGFGSK